MQIKDSKQIVQNCRQKCTTFNEKKKSFKEFLILHDKKREKQSERKGKRAREKNNCNQPFLGVYYSVMDALCSFSACLIFPVLLRDICIVKLKMSKSVLTCANCKLTCLHFFHSFIHFRCCRYNKYFTGKTTIFIYICSFFSLIFLLLLFY